MLFFKFHLKESKPGLPFLRKILFRSFYFLCSWV